MRDIRRPYRSSRSNMDVISKKSQSLPVKDEDKKVKKDFFDKIEKFEKNEYDDNDLEYTKDGKPVMRVSNHFDLKSPKRKKDADDFDLLKRSEFFNSKRKTFDESDFKHYKKAKNRKRRVQKILSWGVVVLAIASLFVWTYFFDTVRITINPKYKDIEVSSDFLIFKDDVLNDYATSTLSKTVLKSAPKEVKQKASGEITIYNNFSASPQILIKNTRFQAKDGKIFKIFDSVTVPGKNGNTPGTINAKVYADSYGSDYNIGPSDFTIPGFKGTQRFTGFYAKSTNAMTGGASGIVQIVSKDDIEVANRELKISTAKDLSTKIQNIIHDGFITIKENPIISYSDNESMLMASDKNSYELTAVANVLSIKSDVLVKMIAEQVLATEYNELESIRFDNIDKLVFTIDKALDADGNIVKVNVKGYARLIWSYDSKNIKNSLRNQKITSFKKILANYSSSIVSTSLEKNPIWINRFPNSINRINIEEVIK